MADPAKEDIELDVALERLTARQREQAEGGGLVEGGEGSGLSQRGSSRGRGECGELSGGGPPDLRVSLGLPCEVNSTTSRQGESEAWPCGQS